MMSCTPLIMQMRHESDHIIPLAAALIRMNETTLLVDSGQELAPLYQAITTYSGTLPNIDWILNTHAHPDHTGSNQGFPESNIIISRTDFSFVRDVASAYQRSEDPLIPFLAMAPQTSLRRAGQIASHFQHVYKNWHPSIIGSASQIQWIEENPELPENIKLWPLPGHTPGHTGILIKGYIKSIFFTGDALPAKRFWRSTLQERIPPWNRSLHLKSKQHIEKFKGIIFPGHDLPFDTETGAYLEGSFEF